MSLAKATSLKPSDFSKKSTRFATYRTIQFSAFHLPDKMHFDILEATVQTYARQRSTSVSLKEVAREVGISYPTFKKKFKSFNQLKEDVMIYVRTVFINLALCYFHESDSNKKNLENYIESCFGWIDFIPSHQAAWTYILRLGNFDPDIRKKNTTMVDTGFERIKSIIKSGNESHEWQVADVALEARKIQIIITGAIFSETTENRSSHEFRTQVKAMCFQNLKT